MVLKHDSAEKIEFLDTLIFDHVSETELEY